MELIMKKILGNPTKKELKLIETLVSNGVRLDAIANSFGISGRTMAQRKLDVPSLAEAFNKGKATGETLVAGKLWKMIEDDKHKGHVAAVFFYLKTQCGWSETQIVEEKKRPGKLKVRRI